ncbi:hypothetical protein [Zeaxanthinibacter enoshimensis]|uniref:hypothetical protein n=1 Tax=Zeaxanthinibacter enoshimensis TaxID=392009 RepID=UPI003569B16D
MKKVQFFGKYTGMILLTALLAIGCSKDNDTPALPEEQLSPEDLETVMESSEYTGAVDAVLTDIFTNEGNSGKSAKGNECYQLEYTETGYMVTFNNCVLNGTDNANGTLEMTFDRTTNSKSFTAIFTDFYIGGIKVNGRRTYTMIDHEDQSKFCFSVTSEMSVVLEDGSEITEEGTRTLTLTLGESFETTTIEISGEWTVTAYGHTYSVTIPEGIVGNLGCEYFVSGAMTLDKNGLIVVVDFGDGECDNIATLIYPNGATQEIELD